MLDQLVKQISDVLGEAGTPPKNPEGFYVFDVDPQLRICLGQASDADMMLYAILGNLDNCSDRFVVKQKMMTGNFLGRETGDARLGIRGESEIMLSQKLPLEQFDEFALEYVERFINYAEAWQQEIANETKK